MKFCCPHPVTNATEDAHPKGAPCFAAALEVMRQAVA